MVFQKCAVCKSSRNLNSKSYFKFPKTPERKVEWIKRLQITKQVKPRTVVCEEHFPSSQKNRCRLKKKALPIDYNNQENSSDNQKDDNISDKVYTTTAASGGGKLKEIKCVRNPLHPLENGLSCQTNPKWNPTAKNDRCDFGWIDHIYEVAAISTVRPLQEMSSMSGPLNQQGLIFCCKITTKVDPTAGDSNENPSDVLKSEDDSLMVTKCEMTPLSNAQLNTCNSKNPEVKDPKLRQKSTIKVLQQKLRRRNLQLKKKKDSSEWLKKFKLCEERSPHLFSWIQSQITRSCLTKIPNYTVLEKSRALTIFYSCGERGYRTLQRLGWKLPALNTIKKWIAPLDLKPGLNIGLLELLREQVSELQDKEKDCIIMWDEMSIKECLQFDKHRDCFEGIEDFGNEDRTLKVATEVLVVMVSSIRKNWKFPLSFYFSSSNTTSEKLEMILKDCMNTLSLLGLRVRMGVCDMSFTNQGLYRRLKVTKLNPFIIFMGRKVYFVHDTPHLIKLFRNNLMTKTFFLSSKVNGALIVKNIKWKYIREFYDKDIRLPSRMAPKLTKHHIFVKDFSKMKVKLATQIFSHSVSSGMICMIMLHQLDQDALPTAKFIKDLDNLFDLLNISVEVDSHKPSRSAINLAQNLDILQHYALMIENLTVAKNSRRPDCFAGLELTILGVKHLITDLKAEGHRYILTRRLQQDSLENMFSFIRSKGGWSKNPTARQFRQNFRFVFLTSVIKQSEKMNCEQVECENNIGNLKALRTFFSLPKKQKTADVLQDCSSSSTGVISEIVNNDDLGLSSSSLYAKQKYSSCPSLHLQDENVALYMANYAVKSVVKRKQCSQCNDLLNGKVSKDNNMHSLIIEKAYNPECFDNIYANVAYSSMVNESIGVIFINISSSFLEIATNSLNSSGKNVSSSIENTILKLDIVKKWIEDASFECKMHRKNMITLFVRAKLFRLVKDINEKWQQSKAWKQTRRDMRNQ